HLKRSAYIILARLQNKERAKSGNKTVRAGTADEGSAGNRQAVVLDGVEHAQPGIRAVARQQDHFHARITGQLAVQRQQLLDQWKRITRWQRLILVLDLVGLVGVQPFLLVHAVTVLEIEQCARTDCDHELAIKGNRHGYLSAVFCLTRSQDTPLFYSR